MTRESRAWGPVAPAGPWDVIVVGAGLGGLTTASMLSQLGKRVLVLEQHTVPGGLTQSFRRAQWAWDVGLHVVGEMGPASLAGRVITALSGDRLRWARVPDPYDVIELPEGLHYGVVGSLAGQQKSLAKLFPAERDNITRYFALMHEASNAMRDYHAARALTPWMRALPGPEARALALTTTREVIERTTPHPLLRALFSAHWSSYGSPPSRSVFGIHALIHRHHRHGAFYPVGGAMSLGRSLAQTVVAHQGWVQTQANVEQVLVEGGRAMGVRLAGGATVQARAVVSAAGAHNTLRLLPPEERVGDWGDAITGLPSSCAHVCLYLGFKGDIRAAGASEANHYVINRHGEELWSCEGEPPGAYFSFPSLKDGEDHAGFHTGQVVVTTEWEKFAPFAGSRWRQRPKDYEALKADLTQKLTRALLRRFPGLEPLIAYRELSTPLSTVHFARGEKGAAYGLEVVRERFAASPLKVRTPVRGLHLAGCDVSLVGITGALVGGLAAAVSVAPGEGGDWLRSAVRPSRQEGLDALGGTLR